MKFILSITLLLASQVLLPAVDLGPDLQIQTISEDCYLIVHSYPWPANALAVRIESNHWLIIDTPYSADAMKRFDAWLTNLEGKSLKYSAIITSYHIDNAGAVEFFLARDEEVFSTVYTAELLGSKAAISLEGIISWIIDPEIVNYYESFDFSQPTNFLTIPVDSSSELFQGRIEVYFPGAGHTEDNIVVYLAREKILFGGCMVLNAQKKSPGNTADADLNQWPVSLKRLLAKYLEAEIVIPGHGQPGSLNLIQHSIEVLGQ
jgi:metallo-beta-lactamase class B